MDGWLGLQGWQWLFLVEALPPIIMSIVTWVLLTDRPKDAAWLRPEQRSWLQQRLDSEQSQRESVHRFELGEAMSNPRVWLLTLVYFGQNVSGYGLLFFLPTIVKSFGVSTLMNGVVSAVPFVFAAVAMIYWSLRSDRSGARTMYVASACLLSAAGLIACVFIGPEHPVWMMVVLILGIMGQYTIAPTFWPLPTAMLSGVAAAGGIALINAVGNLGGFLGPYMFGLIKDATGGSDLIALVAIGAAPVISADHPGRLGARYAGWSAYRTRPRGGGNQHRSPDRLGVVAGDAHARQRPQHRPLRHAQLRHVRTARGEHAAGRRIDRRWRLAPHRHRRLAVRRIERRRRRQQHACIRMQRRREDRSASGHAPPAGRSTSPARRARCGAPPTGRG